MTLIPAPPKATLAQLGLQHKTATIQAINAFGTVDLGRRFDLLRITTNKPGRFRLYQSAATRDADLERAVTADPSPGSGCLFECVTTDALLQKTTTPIPLCAPDLPGNPCAWAWGGAVDATITLEIIQLEA